MVSLTFYYFAITCVFFKLLVFFPNRTPKMLTSRNVSIHSQIEIISETKLTTMTETPRDQVEKTLGKFVGDLQGLTAKSNERLWVNVIRSGPTESHMNKFYNCSFLAMEVIRD